MSPSLSRLCLRQGAERRLRGGHLWVYSNEVDTRQTPLGSFSAGELVAVTDARGTVLGSAYMEPQELICARLYAPGETQPLDQALLEARFAECLASRTRAFAAPYYRLAYGDSDFVPGLVVDRFGEYLVLQLNNAGIEQHESAVINALQVAVAPRGILLRADSRARRERGLPERVEVVAGEVPEQLPLIENGVRFSVPAWAGQKTGWFYDHRQSRARLAAYVAGADVLDVYSYVGGWGIQAAAFGARSVLCVDSSASALEQVAGNAALNAVAEKVSTHRGSADQVMQALAEQEQTFDVVVLDPPAFIQRRKDLRKGVKAYRRINELGLRLVRPGGVLVAGSCSMQLPREELVGALAAAAGRCGVRLQILEQGGQGPDHPVHPSIPETDYLKAIFTRRLP